MEVSESRMERVKKDRHSFNCETHSPVQSLSRSVQSHPTVFTVTLRQWALIHFSDWGGGGGGKSKKNVKIFAKSGAAKLKIVYVK